MQKPPTGLVQKRKGYATEPFKKAVVLLTPLRLVQLLGFIVIFFFCLQLAKTPVAESINRTFYDYFLKAQIAPQVHPAIIYIGIDRKSLQSIKPFPWPKRYYAAMTRILREWGAKEIVFQLFFTPGTDAAEDNQALLEEFKKTNNFYLPVSFESEGFKNYYYVNQSDPMFSEQAKGIGHINYSQDPDNVIRRIYPFVKFNQTLMPHLGVRVAYDFLGKPVPTPDHCDFPRDSRNNLLIHWTKRWNDVAGYYSFVDILNNYALITKNQPAAIRPEDFKGKICLIGLTASDYKTTPLEANSPGIGVVGNIINTILTGSFIRVASPAINGLLLFLLAILATLLFIPFRSVFSTVAGLLWAGLYIAISYLAFLLGGLWLDVATPLFLILLFFLYSLILTKAAEYKERLYFLSLAVRDELTGLYVMRYMSTLLYQAMNYSRMFRKPFSVILLDIDDFKKVNDAYGYRAGDTVLKKIAEIIQNSVRNKGRALPDLAGRYGEEEFIILLVGYNLATATFTVAERIRKAIERVTFQEGGKAFSVSVSAGVSVLRSGEKNPDKVVERAQEALLKAKTSGKNQTCIKND